MVALDTHLADAVGRVGHGRLGRRRGDGRQGRRRLRRLTPRSGHRQPPPAKRAGKRHRPLGDPPGGGRGRQSVRRAGCGSGGKWHESAGWGELQRCHSGGARSARGEIAEATSQPQAENRQESAELASRSADPHSVASSGPFRDFLESFPQPAMLDWPAQTPVVSSKDGFSGPASSARAPSQAGGFLHASNGHRSSLHGRRP